MKIVIGYPPNIEDIKKRFDIAGRSLLITFGDTLYNPDDAYIPDHKLVHEERHSLQHLSYPGGAEAYIKRYFEDKSFRRQSEAEAYGDQYAFFCDHVKDRNQRAKFLHTLIKDFMSPIYDLGISYSEAEDLIIKNSI